MKHAPIVLSLVLTILQISCDGQRIPEAAIDLKHVPMVTSSIAIPSHFTNLPIVEPHISAHPANNDHLLAAAMVVTDINKPYESCRLVSFVSTNGGASWKETIHDWWGYDPWTAIASDGTAVLSWIGTSGSFQDKYPVVLFTSSDAGNTWSEKVQTLPGMFDGTKLVESNNKFYFTTVRFREGEGADVVFFARNDEHGFVESAILDGQGARLNFCEPAVSGNGTVVIPAASREAIWVQHYDLQKRVLSGQKTMARRPGNWKGYARMTGNYKSLKFNNHIYFVRAMGSSGLLVHRSTDGGNTWEREMRIDLHADGLVINALVPSVAINTDGVLGATWVNQKDGRSASQVWFTASYDGGISFTRPVRLSETTNPGTSKNGDVANKFPGGGHYLGLTARVDGSFQAIWSDSRTGLFQLQTCTIR